MRNYEEGAADYLQVLTAQRSFDTSQTALADNATMSALSVVALYKALGGGWSPGTVVHEATVTVVGAPEVVQR